MNIHGAFTNVGNQKSRTDVHGMQDAFTRHSQFLSRSRKRVTVSSGRNTFTVIGSTGFVGPYIVASQLRCHAESSILCVNRADNGKERTLSALRAIFGDLSSVMHRLQFLVADVATTTFGLDAVQTARMISEADEVIFNAWDSNWAKPLSHFEPLLKALRNTIDWCIAAHICPRLTFVSSICAVGDWPLWHSDEPRVPEDVVWDNHAAMPHGYGESKCVAEQILATAHERTGLHVNIVRAGQIAGPSGPDGRGWPRQGWIHSIIKASMHIGFFPLHVQPLDWIPVDVFADGIAKSTGFAPISQLQVFNMVHPEPASWNVLHDTLSESGVVLQTCSLPDWLKRLDRRHLKLYGFLEGLGEGRENSMTFRNEKALTVLPPVLRISKHLLGKWLMGWKLVPGDPKARL